MDPRALTVVIVLAACAGPDPHVLHAVATPSPLPGATRVSLEIENRAGKGTIELQIELRADSGIMIRAERTLEIAQQQTVHYETDVETPKGAYSVRATAQYPD